MNTAERAFWTNKQNRTQGKGGRPAKVAVSKPISAPVSKMPASSSVSKPIKEACAGKALAAKRRVVGHTCLQCDDKFMGIAIAIYCSNRCRQRAKYQRKGGNRVRDAHDTSPE